MNEIYRQFELFVIWTDGKNVEERLKNHKSKFGDDIKVLYIIKINDINNQKYISEAEKE